MAADLGVLRANLTNIFGDKLVSMEERLGELTIVVGAADMLDVLTRLHDAPELRFEQLIDLCGVDYSTYGSDVSEGGAYFASDIPAESASAYPHRFAVVYNLLSVSNNARIRVRVFADEDEFPVLPSVIDIWTSANWYEREAYDLYGIRFAGHPDLRRILLPFEADFHPLLKKFEASSGDA